MMRFAFCALTDLLMHALLWCECDMYLRLLPESSGVLEPRVSVYVPKEKIEKFGFTYVSSLNEKQ
jgi:hypothetical protein